VDRCLPENSTYIVAFQHFVVDSQLFGLRKSSDAAATAAIAFSSFSVFCQFVFFHLQNKTTTHKQNKQNKTAQSSDGRDSRSSTSSTSSHSSLCLVSFSFSFWIPSSSFLFSLPSGVAAARTINTATVVVFPRSLLLLFFYCKYCFC
jgi:hypothetical protein